MFFSLDPMYYLFALPAFLLALYAQIKVKSVYAKYKGVPLSSGYSGAEVANQILYNANCNVEIEPIEGVLTDHYDPTEKTLRLSREIYYGTDIASAGVAAHEAGHAIQDAKNYLPLHLRNAMVPIVNFGSWLSWPMIFLGALMGSLGLIKWGIILFSGLVIFQILTLPVELDASRRAVNLLQSCGILTTTEEVAGVKEVLWAAALTYIAATISAIMELLYFLVRFGLIGGDDE